MDDFSKYNSGVQLPALSAHNTLRSQNREFNEFHNKDRFFFDGVAPQIGTLKSIGKFDAEKINRSLWGLGSVNTNQNPSQQREGNKMLKEALTETKSGGSFLSAFSPENNKFKLL